MADNQWRNLHSESTYDLKVLIEERIKTNHLDAAEVKGQIGLSDALRSLTPTRPMTQRLWRNSNRQSKTWLKVSA